MIELKNISKKFGDRQILQNISFKFEKNKKYIIRGKNGIGKTTLLNLMAGYIAVDNGAIEMSKNLRLEYLFQDIMLFSNLTVKENMLIKYLAHNKISGFDDKFSQTLKDMQIAHLSEQKVSILSGGEKQRVQLANIIMSNPNVVLMDEPVSNIDKESRKEISALISNIFSDKTVIMINHDEDKIFENAVVINLSEGGINT